MLLQHHLHHLVSQPHEGVDRYVFVNKHVVYMFFSQERRVSFLSFLWSHNKMSSCSGWMWHVSFFINVLLETHKWINDCFFLYSNIITSSTFIINHMKLLQSTLICIKNNTDTVSFGISLRGFVFFLLLFQFGETNSYIHNPSFNLTRR